MEKIINYENGDKNQKYQGDILILRVNADKVLDYRKISSEGFVVAEGEVTGHQHKVVPREHSVVEIANDGLGFYLKVQGVADLVHQEHQTVPLQEGIYYIGRQYEYDELAEYRKVQD